jgi:hypothetical protein
MKHAAAIALVAGWLMLPSPVRAAGPVAVPGTADVKPAPVWYLMLPPIRHNWDTAAPFSQWTKIKTFVSEKECRAHSITALEDWRWREIAAHLGGKTQLFIATSSYSPKERQNLRCVSAKGPPPEGKITHS